MKIFNKIRQRLIADFRFAQPTSPAGRYLIYALGEIVLVVAGILIALQINTWNEKKRQRENFGLALEQIYNDIDVQAQSLTWVLESAMKEIGYINLLLEEPEKIPDTQLPFVLFYVDAGSSSGDIIFSKREVFHSIMEVDPGDLGQIQIEKQIASFMDNTIWNVRAQEGLITPILFEAGIPIPQIIKGLTNFENFKAVDTLFFKSAERARVRSLLSGDRIRTALRSLKADRQKITSINLANSLADAASVMELIRQYQPGIRLLYNEVGIIGTAIAGYDGAPSTPMTLTDAQQCLWEADLHLKKGTVKFRTRNSWKQNWGGKTFPEGSAIYYWENIPVEEGYYHVELNLLHKTYAFTKKEPGT